MCFVCRDLPGISFFSLYYNSFYYHRKGLYYIIIFAYFIGTSMSAPHVCGAVALLISGLQKNNISYSPYSIKRALWNSATYLTHVDKFAQGNGLLNVEKAYDHLVKYYDRKERNVRYQTYIFNCFFFILFIIILNF